jgi:hypothetical protein
MRHSRSLLRLLATLTLVALTACGGGGASDPGGQPPANRAPVAAVSAPASAQVGDTLTLDGSASHDPDGDVLRYRWTLLAQPAGAAVGLDDPTSPKPSFVATVAGSYQWSLVVGDDALDSAAATVVVVVMAAAGPPTIVLDQAEPVTGAVTFTLSSPHPGAVSWYVDLAFVGRNEAGTDSWASWDATRAAKGTHLVVAQLYDAHGGWAEVRRSFEVGDPPIAMASRARELSGLIEVDISASSVYGIESVSATLDGRSLGRLTEPNGCGPFNLQGCFGPPFSGWLFELDPRLVGPGEHSMLITAVDRIGRSQTLTQSLVIGPQITITAPQQGAVFYGKLPIRGQVQAASAVAVRVLLGGTPILSSDGPEFAGEYDLGGITPNRYKVTIEARDAAGNVTLEERTIAVAPSPDWVRAPAVAIPYPGAHMEAVRGDLALLFISSPETAVLRDIDSGHEATLAIEGDRGFMQFSSWTLGSDHVYALGKAGDCDRLTCLYRWDRSGRRSNLSAAQPGASPGQTMGALPPRAVGQHALWIESASNGRQLLLLQDAAGGDFVQVADTAALGLRDSLAYDVGVDAGVVSVVFAGAVHGASPSSYRVYEWRSDSGRTRLIAERSGVAGVLRSDGGRAIWIENPLAGGKLLALPLGGGPVQTLVPSFAAQTFEVQEDGSLSWGRSVLLDGVVRTLPDGQAAVFAVGEGWIFFVRASENMLYAWNVASGRTEPMFDANAAKGWVTAGYLVFQYLGMVYRIAL